MSEQAPDRQPNYERLDHIDRLLLEQGIDLSVTPEELAVRGIHRVNFWEQGIKNAEGRHETHPLAAIELRPSMAPDGAWQAERAQIRPSRAKPEKRDHNKIFVTTDWQVGWRRCIDGRTSEQEFIPLHDIPAMRVAQQLAKYEKPNEVWNLGDTIDYPELSRFPVDSDHFHKTLGMSHQTVHDEYAQYRANLPWAVIKEVGSNHVDRYMASILKRFPEIYDMYRPGDDSQYPINSYPYMANLEALDVEFIGGGQEAQIIYGEDYEEEINGRMYRKPPIIASHGTETGQDGKAVTKVMRRHLGAIAVQGHAHTLQMTMKANRHGQYEGAIMVPPLCRTTGEVPSYHSGVTEQNRVRGNQEEWPQGVLIIEDYQGNYRFDFVAIRNGVAYHKGQRFDGNE